MLVKGAYLVLGNWKMHGDVNSAAELAAAVARESVPAEQSGVSVGIAPTHLHITTARQVIFGDEVLLGAQDCRAEDNGAYTGDISAAMLKQAGCSFIIAGHSERRYYHGEQNGHVKAKAQGILRQGLHAVVCVGESAADREAGTHLQVVEQQIRGSLPAQFTRDTLTVAYEPVWAIGSGKTATAQDISEMHSHIRNVLQQLSAEAPRILYGGSVNANNALDILALPVVDGVLVGGASLDANAFQTIIQAAQTAAKQR